MTSTARATLIIVAANLAVYFLMLAGWLLEDLFPELPERMMMLLALPSSSQDIAKEPWTIVTYMFTHSSFVHLTVNMLWLVGFGPMIKGRWIHTVGTYIAGGICGMIAYEMAASFGEKTGELVGASSAVIAVVIATACLSPSRKLRMIFIGDVKVQWVALIAILTMFAGRDIFSPSSAAHFGGVLCGVCIGMVLRRQDRWLSRKAMERARRHTHRLSLIQKASQSGFASLSDVERLELFDLKNES